MDKIICFFKGHELIHMGELVYIGGAVQMYYCARCGKVKLSFRSLKTIKGDAK
jgi:hypothetical protein